MSAIPTQASERIPTWPSWNSVLSTQSVRDHYAPIIRQVAAGNPTGVEAEMQAFAFGNASACGGP